MACPSFGLVWFPAKSVRRKKVFSHFLNEFCSSTKNLVAGKWWERGYVPTVFYGGFLSSVLAFQGSKKFAKEDFVCSPTFMRIAEAVNKTETAFPLCRVELYKLNSAYERFCNQLNSASETNYPCYVWYKAKNWANLVWLACLTTSQLGSTRA